jgi:hypothetical protein
MDWIRNTWLSRIVPFCFIIVSLRKSNAEFKAIHDSLQYLIHNDNGIGYNLLNYIHQKMTFDNLFSISNSV